MSYSYDDVRFTVHADQIMLYRYGDAVFIEFDTPWESTSEKLAKIVGILVENYTYDEDNMSSMRAAVDAAPPGVARDTASAALYLWVTLMTEAAQIDAPRQTTARSARSATARSTRRR